MKIIISILLSFILLDCSAQNVGLDWVEAWGGTGSENAKVLRNDSQDNLYVIGRFDGTVDFDPGPNIVSKTSNGGLDIYISKFNSNGTFLWVHTFGNSSHDIVEHAQVDQMDNIILTGRFVDSVDFDPSAGVDNIAANGLSDVYIFKMDASGNYLWTKTFGGAGHETSRGLAINSSNDITIAGRFLNTVDFDPGPAVANKTALTVDIYILQLNAAGVFNWVKTLEGPLNSGVQVNDLMYDANDNLLMNAAYKDTIDVDPGPGTQYLIDSIDPLQYNLFILKLDAAGNYVWAKQFDNAVGNSVGISTLAFDSMGNYYLGGFFVGTVDFDFGPAASNLYAPKSCSYILKVDSNGSFIWARHWGGYSGNAPEYETLFDIAIDGQSNLTLCGTFKGHEDFDPGPAIFFLGSPNNLSHIHGYIMQLDSAGMLNWAKNIGGLPSAASVNNIVRNNQGDIYATGDFYDNTDFDFNAGVTNIMAQGGWDAFLLKIKDCSNSSATDVINSCKPIIWIDGNTYSQSNFNAMDTLMSVDGCDSFVTLNLTITPIDTSVNEMGNTLDANATNVSYQWVNCETNFSPILGETNQSFTASMNGSYAVILNNGICSDTSSCYPFTALAVNNFEEINSRVFPNPATGQVKIVTDFNKALLFRLYNQMGQIILEKEILDGDMINLADTPKGLYLYTLWDKSAVVSKGKLVLE